MKETKRKKATQEMKAEIIGSTIVEIRPLTKAERAEHDALKNMPKTAQVINLNNGKQLYADALTLVFYEF
jgi:hypothetical protein